MFTSTMRSSCKSSDPSLGAKSLSSIECNSFSDSELKQVVKDLVLSKYGFKLDKIYRRSVKRKQKKKYYNYRSMSSGFSSQTSFANTADDDDYSIGTEDISQLISPSEVALTPNSSRFDLNKSKFKFPTLSKAETIHPKTFRKRKILEEINMIDNRIGQILKALHFSAKNDPMNPKFKARLEAEKFLLISTMKKDLLRDALEEVERNPGADNIKGTVTVTKMQLHNSHQISEDQYFLCVLSTDCRIFSTEIVQGKYNEAVSFNSRIEIPNLPTDFRIDVRFFMAAVEKENNKFHFCPQITSPTKSIKDVGVPARPSIFRYWGETEITTDYVTHPETFHLSNITLQKNQCRLSAIIVGKPQINCKLAGFLDMSRRKNPNCSFWSKYWCQLEGDKIIIWNYPNDIMYGHPVDSLDLKDCINVRIPGENECSRFRSFILSFRLSETSSCDYYFAAESAEDFEKWVECFATIVRVIQKWDNFNCIDGMY